MGLLIRSDGTQRIIETLNAAFDGPSPTNGPPLGLDVIRSYAFLGTPPTGGLSTFGNTIQDRSWAGGVLADALDLKPKDGNGNSNPNHNRRWTWFLQHILGPDATVFTPLRNALADAILSFDSSNKPLIVRVTFDHVELEDPNTSNPDPDTPLPIANSIVIFDAPLAAPNAGTFGTVRHITLFTPPVPKKK